jgi:hypothetical protein
MSATTLIAELRKRRVFLFRRGDELRWRAPKGMITPELLEWLRAHKAEILDLVDDRPPTAEEVLSSIFEDVDRRRARVKIRSRLLGIDLWLVAAGDRGPGDGLPVYTTTEVRELLKLRPETIADAVQRAHLAKLSFGPAARIEEVLPA